MPNVLRAVVGSIHCICALPVFLPSSASLFLGICVLPDSHFWFLLSSHRTIRRLSTLGSYNSVPTQNYIYKILLYMYHWMYIPWTTYHHLPLLLFDAAIIDPQYHCGVLSSIRYSRNSIHNCLRPSSIPSSMIQTPTYAVQLAWVESVYPRA